MSTFNYRLAQTNGQNMSPPSTFQTISNMVNYLTNQDPSILNFRDKNGNTLLHITMMYSKDPGNMAKFFIDNGLSAEAKNNNNLTPIEVGRKRIEDVKKKELENNTEMFLEPFVTLGKAEEDKQPVHQ